MAKVGAQRAAELTGRSKSTIQRAMNSGKLSYEMDANNRRIIDVSELERVFGLQSAGEKKENNDSGEAEMKKAADMLEMERMKMQIKMLENQLETAEGQLEDLKEQRDQWQKQAQQVLLTSQYSQKQAEELKAELKDREEKARQRRQQMLEERMNKMKGHNQNQSKEQTGQKEAHAHTPNKPETEDSAGGETGTTHFDFQGLWQKIKGRATAA